MKKSWLLGVALAGSFALAAPAHAFLIDGFGDPQGPVEADASDPVSPTSTIAITDTDFVNAERSLSVTQEKGIEPFPDGQGVDAKVIGGLYFYNQDSFTFGTGTVEWSGFEPVAFESPVNILISVLEADDDQGLLTFTLGSGANEWSYTVNLPEVDAGDDPVNVLFPVSGFPEGTLFDRAELFVDGRGASALDLAVDFIAVPAPGVLGLLGLGLAGLAFVARRRRDSVAA